MNGSKYAWLERKLESEDHVSEVLSVHSVLLTRLLAAHMLPWDLKRSYPHPWPFKVIGLCFSPKAGLGEGAVDRGEGK